MSGSSEVLELCLRIGAVCAVLTSLEYVVIRGQLTEDGLMAPGVAALRRRLWVVGPVARGIRAVAPPDRFAALMGVRGALALLLAAAPLSLPVAGAVAVAVAALMVAAVVRCPYGLDGADQMSSIVLVALGIGAMLDTELSRAAALSFVALQATLSYATAGVAKLFGPAWRDGSALPAILGARIYGHPGAAAALRGAPGAARALGHSVIALEVTFPLLLFASPETAVVALVAGAAFHLGSAVLMGLNTFLWAFLAAYPALYWLAEHASLAATLS